MNRPLSIYLDLLRFAAAMVVFLGHAAGQRLSGGFLWQMGEYGPKAVMVFFVLSGFVIAYAADQRERNARSYVVNRLARLYSVVIPALLLTAMLDFLGQRLDPGAYAVDSGYGSFASLANPLNYLLSFFFLNEIWGIRIFPGSNLPYWSMGYEFWYYALFFAWTYCRGRMQLLLFLAIAALVGPPILALFPVWLLGVLGYRITRTRRLGHGLGAGLFLGSIAVFLAYEYASGLGDTSREVLPSVMHVANLNLLEAYLLGLLTLANILGAFALSDVFARPLEHVAAPIRWAAGHTFSIYLFHMPILQFLTAATGGDRASLDNRLILYAGSLGLILLLARISEHRKDAFRRAIERILGRLAAPLRPSGAA